MGARTIRIDPRELRTTAAFLLGAALVLPAVPGHPVPACPLRTLTGVPCPLCGMTTSVEETARLDVGAALAANPGGAVAVLAAVAVLVARPARVRVPSVAAWAVVAAMWLFELHRFSLL